MRLVYLSLEASALVGLVYFCLLFMTFPSASAAVYKSGQARYCGRRLVDTLAFVCNGRYNSRKRFDQDADTGRSGESSDIYQSLRGLTSRDEMNPMTYLAKRATMIRNTRGAYDDCCEQPCGLHQLLRYCMPPTSTAHPSHRSSSMAGISQPLAADNPVNEY